MDETTKKDLRLGYIFLGIFALLIIGGILTKRVFNRPGFMMLWHLPAAVFLVLGGQLLTKANRRRYYQKILEKQDNT
jgi:hypothetical protein